MTERGVTRSLTMVAAILVSASGDARAQQPAVRLLDDRIVYETAIGEVDRSVYALAGYLDGIGDPKRRQKAASAQGVLSVWSDELTSFCAERGVNPYLAAAVIVAESNGVETATSHVGAAGLMQIMPSTASELNVLDRRKGADSIYGGCRYLSQMLTKYEDDEVLALAAYNAGPGAVKKHGGVPPFTETRRYIIRVARAWPEWPLEGTYDGAGWDRTQDGSVDLEGRVFELLGPRPSITFQLSPGEDPDVPK